MTPTLEELGLDKLTNAQMRGLAKELLARAKAPEDEAARRARGQLMAAAMQRIADRGGIQSIPDPVAWQREMREDRELPGRSE